MAIPLRTPGLLRWLEIRFVVLLASCTSTNFLEWLSRKIYPPCRGSTYVFRISPHVVMKGGHRSQMSEPDAMRYLSANTQIPIPTVYKSWTYGKGAVFLMEWFNEAYTLKERWHMLSESDKDTIACQIRTMIDELREIPQPSILQGQVCQFDGSACWDGRLKFQFCGPFSSESAFNQFRLSLLDIYLWEPGARMEIEQLSSKLRTDHRIVLTHGDLSAKNILVDDHSNVVALLDWEMTGWRPEHWEYLKIIHGRWEDDDWRRIAPKMVTPYDEEMEIDDQFIIINGGAPF